jgi:predicted flavoprotein YhiN
MTQHPIVIVGAGAAGLTAAIRAAESGARVVLLNAHPKVGLKILMSGGTRCNVTHREVTERDFNGGSSAFVRRILSEFTAQQSREWLARLGVELKLEDTGKYFPASDDAQTVLDALLGAATKAGVELHAGTQVVRLERLSDDLPPDTDTARFRVGVRAVHDSATFAAVRAFGIDAFPLPSAEPERWIEARSVILATGGLSFPRTGSDGVGYAIARALGHTIEPPIPALTPLVSEDPLRMAVQGLALPTELTLWVDGRKSQSVIGSLLFAHFGYSGPAALDISRHWLRAEGHERRLTARFTLEETHESLLAKWVDAARDSARGARGWAERWVPQRLAERLCDEAGLAGEKLSQIDKTRRTALIDRLVARDLAVTSTLGFEKAEVTAGGVRLSEVSPKTLESRIARGLHLCGEILDVEGRLGGFNFQWAWSSGTVAGRAAAST